MTRDEIYDMPENTTNIIANKIAKLAELLRSGKGDVQSISRELLRLARKIKKMNPRPPKRGKKFFPKTQYKKKHLQKTIENKLKK